MSTAELEPTVATPSEPVATPVVETPAPAPEANGEKPAAKPERARDESGKFRGKDPVERFREKKAAREAGIKPAPEVAPSSEKPAPVEKPVEKKQEPVAQVDDALIRRAEEAGLTPYEAKKLGPKLEAEISRRAEEKRQAEIDALVEKKLRERQAPSNEQPSSKSQPSADDLLSKLDDLPPEYGEDMVSRDRLLREELQRSRDALRELHSLHDEVNALKQMRQEEAERREREAQIARASQFDKALAELGSDFEPVFGRGTFETIGSTPYLRTRTEAYSVAEVLAQVRPDLDYRQIAQAAAYALYPDLHESIVEKRVLERARKSSSSVTPNGGTHGSLAPGFDGDVAKHPRVQATISKLRANRQGA